MECTADYHACDTERDGIEQTGLVEAAATDIGGKRFFSGTVTDKYQKVKVVFPRTLAYVALERIAYIRVLDSAKPQNGGKLSDGPKLRAASLGMSTTLPRLGHRGRSSSDA